MRLRCCHFNRLSTTVTTSYFRPLWKTSSPALRKYSSTSSTTTKPSQTIFSGIQPTGVPHIGNYLGALLQWVTLQNSSPPSTNLLFSIVDLHAITLPQNAKQLWKWKRETLATLRAVGLDGPNTSLFFQSAVSLAWACIQMIALLRSSEKHGG